MGPDADFIRSQTVLQSPPLVPEIKLHLATEVTPLWQMTEEKFAQTNPGSGSGAGMPPPFWAFAWPGGQGLARYVLDHPDEVRGKRVLDFGCGGGIAAIAAHKAGAARVLACDIDPLAQLAAEMNAGANGATLEIMGEIDMQKPFRKVDVILAGDVCYQQAMSATVTRWLRLSAEAGARVLIADPGRAWVPQEGLEEIVRYEVPTSRELEDRESRTVIVWKMV